MSRPLPAGYHWGIAKRSRFAARPVPHIVDQRHQTVCTGADALIEGSSTGRKPCSSCVAWLEEMESDD